MSIATENLKKNIEDTGEAARRTAGSAAEVASEAVGSVRTAVADRVDSARDALSETGDRLAETLRRAAEHADVNALKDGVAAAVSTGVAATATALRERSVTELVDDIHAAARRHPGLFMAGAALAGFALARLLTSSRERRP